MAEITFVGLAVLVWMFVICLAAGTLGAVVLIAHVVKVETRYRRRAWRIKKARQEMLERQARNRRDKERQARKQQFYADIEEIINDR